MTLCIDFLHNRKRIAPAAPPLFIRCGLAALLLIAAGAAGAAEAIPPWDEEALAAFASLPVQDEGRVKPLDTFARFALLRLNGKRSLSLPEGGRKSSLEWLLDTLLYPELAADQPCFSIDTHEAVMAIGVPVRGKKRDRYSYNELKRGREKLMELGGHYNEIPQKNRSFLQNQLVSLANNVLYYEDLIHFFDFARQEYTVQDGSEFSKAYGAQAAYGMADLLRRTPAALDRMRELRDQLDATEIQRESDAMGALFDAVGAVVQENEMLAMIPHPDPAVKEWSTPSDLMRSAFQGFEVPHAAQLDQLALIERLVQATGDTAAFKSALQALHQASCAAAEERGEYAKIPLEVRYYQRNYFFYAQWLYVLCFFVIALTWLQPKRKLLYYATSASVLLPTAFLIAGITMRCIIRGRPPVTTLYETILFSTAVAVLVALAVEWINRQRTAVGTGAILGVIGLFLAYRYEARGGMDTMPSVIAVLDTNFWLATHVTTITAGYAAGLVAAALAHAYILGRLIGFRKAEPAFYSSLGRMIYGVVCFSLFFSILGTILGGVWANESWGRFWGWDPKENGALMICLWALIILHARRGGYIALLGSAICAVILGMIVVFSWWGVNMLGVGLHSYGFTSGIMNALAAFWIAEGVIVLLGMVVWQRDRGKGPA